MEIKTGEAGTVKDEQKILTLLFRAETDKKHFVRDMKDTLQSFADDIELSSKAEVVLVFDSRDSIDRKLCRELSGAVKVRSSSRKGLNSKTLGRYIMPLAAGDTIDAGRLLRLIGRMEETDAGVYKLRTAAADGKAAGAIPTEPDDWRSIFTDRYSPLLDPHAVAVRSELADRVSDLMAAGLKASKTLIKAVLASRGYVAVDARNDIYSDYRSELGHSINSDIMQDMLDFSMEKYGCVEPYLQSCFLELFRRQLESGGRKDKVSEFIGYVEDELIAGTKALNLRQRSYFLNIKYGTDVLREAEIEDSGTIMFNGTKIAMLRSLRVRLDITDIEGDCLQFEGRTDMHMLGDGYRLYVRSSEGEEYDIAYEPFEPFDKIGFDRELYYQGMMFRLSLPVKDGLSYRFCLEDRSGRIFVITPQFATYSGFVEGAKFKSLDLEGYNISFSNDTFSIRALTRSLHRRNERRYMKYLCSKRKYKVALYRLLYHLDTFLFRKPVWLVADRPHVAKDNGEHMFRYLQTTEAAEQNDIYFVVMKNTPDYQRLKAVGKVLPYGSTRHKIKFLRARVILCAAANDLMINPLGKSGKYYRDLYRYDFVYLRHGVSHNDQSRWINKLGKNIRILVATCRPEYEGILNGPYDYTEREVKLTGLPRFDNLYDERKKEILILPTWRKNLQGELEKNSSQRAFVENFVDSDYCRFYNALINDERLLSVMEKYGYKGTFYLHPVFEKQFGDFKSSRLISVGQGIADYQELFRKSALMVTDFSSVAFDFAYLKKPVIYSQFDEKEFYLNHSWGKGYFTYREDGFGPITNTLDETVEELIDYIENDCRMKEEYVKKVENFFAYTDRNNCRRVYEAIMETERS